MTVIARKGRNRIPLTGLLPFFSLDSAPDALRHPARGSSPRGDTSRRARRMAPGVQCAEKPRYLNELRLRRRVFPNTRYESWLQERILRKTTTVLLALSALALGGCVAVGLTAIGVGMATGVSPTLSGVGYKTLTAPHAPGK